MTLEDFRLATELMFQAFTPIKASDRLRALYEFFKLESIDDVIDAFKITAFEQERFPSVQFFGSVLKRVKEKRLKNSDVVIADCKWCGSTGVVSAKDEKNMSWAYHCLCVNGSRYRNYIAWFGGKHPGKILITEIKSESQCPF